MEKSQALDLLKKYKLKNRVLKHSLVVNKFAISLSKDLIKKGKNIDLNLVDVSSLLHDIGRSISGETKKHHSIEGYNILMKEGYPKIAGIIKKHGLAWIDKDTLDTIEEKIVWYSDKRVDEDEVVSLNKRLELLETRHPGVTLFIEKIRKKIEGIEKELIQ